MMANISVGISVISVSAIVRKISLWYISRNAAIMLPNDPMILKEMVILTMKETFQSSTS